jgi:hypothetical protein
MVRIHPDPPDDSSLFNNLGYMKVVVLAKARALRREGVRCDECASSGDTGLCIASCLCRAIGGDAQA